MDNVTFAALAIRASNMACLVASLFSALLLVKSMLDYSQTGPQLRREIMSNYRSYLVFSLARLTLATLMLALALALPGAISYLLLVATLKSTYSDFAAALAAAASIGVLVSLRFCRALHDSPGLIVASSHYAMSHFYPLWRWLSASRLDFITWALLAGYTAWSTFGTVALYAGGARSSAVVLLLTHGAIVAAYLSLVRSHEPRRQAIPLRAGRPNLLMIGSDTLRADRLGFAGYRRALTPNLDRLASNGVTLSECYVPCARTAPSLLSMLTGTWPHRHGIRDNFVADAQTRVDLPTLPTLLADVGYHTAALGDWAGSDLGKYTLGYKELDVPDDQWNVKFLLRQGPKDIRLFLSLFADNTFGKYFLNEIYYLAGVPRTRQVGLLARQTLYRLGRSNQPFYLNVFMASTHPPFASDHPYYKLFAHPDYRGPSKFAMARLTDPFEVIRRQAEPRTEFDLDQILDLYDGSVKSFDDEVGRILSYLEQSGLSQNTLVVVYSDHGMEFFEHDTWGQGNSAIGEHSARIPIVISGPPLKTSRQLDGVTRSIDLAPTLLDLLGLPVPPSMEGVSLAPALFGAAQPELAAFHETGIWLTEVPGMPPQHLRYPNLLELLEVPERTSSTLAIKPEYQMRVIAAKDRMVRRGRWKLVYLPLVEGKLLRLFDLETDPHCLRDVSPDYPAVTAELWDLLRGWMRADPLLEFPDRSDTLDSSAGSLSQVP